MTKELLLAIVALAGALLEAFALWVCLRREWD